MLSTSKPQLAPPCCLVSPCRGGRGAPERKTPCWARPGVQHWIPNKSNLVFLLQQKSQWLTRFNTPVSSKYRVFFLAFCNVHYRIRPQHLFIYLFCHWLFKWLIKSKWMAVALWNIYGSKLMWHQEVSWSDARDNFIQLFIKGSILTQNLLYWSEWLHWVLYSYFQE